MLVRTITSIILVILLAGILWVGELGIGLVLALFTIIGTLELYRATEQGGNQPIKWISVLFAVPVVLYTVNTAYDFLRIAVYLIAALIFIICIRHNEKHSVVDALITLAAGVVVGNLFYSVLSIYKMGGDRVESGALLFLCLIGAFVTDIFAYFVGVAFGKHKLCPNVSPKKSVEGSIGGIIGATVVMALYGHFVLSKHFVMFANVSVTAYLILGLVCGVVSQVGDLAASMIKRHYGIKDYGTLFPGHGGILDRFDSFLFVAPAVQFVLSVSVTALGKFE